MKNIEKLIIGLKELCGEENAYYAHINGGKIKGMAFISQKSLQEILSKYLLSSRCDKKDTTND